MRNPEFAMAVPEDRIIFKVIEFAERHRDGTAPALRHEGQNSVRKENATRRSFSLYQQRSENRRRGNWNRNRRVLYQRVIYAAGCRGIGQHVVGALQSCARSVWMRSASKPVPEPIGETQFLCTSRHVADEASL